MIDALASTVRRPNRIQLALIATVAASGGLVTLSLDGSPWIALLATVAGAPIGVVLVAYLTWIAPDSGQARDPFERP